MGNTKGIWVELSAKGSATAKDLEDMASWLEKHLDEPGSITFFDVVKNEGESTSLEKASEVSTYKKISIAQGKLSAEGITSWIHFEDQLAIEAAKHNLYGTARILDFDAGGDWTMIIPKELTYKKAIKQVAEAEERLNAEAKKTVDGRMERMKA